MINDVIIIKDGIPLLSKNFPNLENNTQNNLFSQNDNLIMISGFFSALNSFSDQFDELGSISELKFDSKKNNLKLSFLKDKSIPNLIYLATFDEKSNGVNVHRYLRKISNTFLKKYNINQIINWNGRTNTFKDFEKIIETYVSEEKDENDVKFKDKVIELFNNIQEKLNENTRISKDFDLSEVRTEKIEKIEKNEKIEKIIKQKERKPEYYKIIPSFKISKKVNSKHFLTGDNSHKVFNQINGKKTIIQISNELEINPEKVYNICKNLIKLGFIHLSK